MNNTINIGQKDVLWNYAATFLQIGVGVILLPLVVKIYFAGLTLLLYYLKIALKITFSSP
jgi:hypothetical protein